MADVEADLGVRRPPRRQRRGPSVELIAGRSEKGGVPASAALFSLPSDRKIRTFAGAEPWLSARR
jgi:hypothetical protein